MAAPKTHIPGRDGRTFCGYDYQAHDLVVIDLKRVSIESATCKNCQKIDDARMVKDYHRECAESGIDPNTLLPLPKRGQPS